MDPIETWHDAPQFERMEAKIKALEDELKTANIKTGGVMSNVLTCVYCGHQYPEGTPPAKAEALTNHIKQCEKHPMRKLRNALAGLVGASTKDELEKLELGIRMAPAPDADKVSALNAVHVLIETASE